METDDKKNPPTVMKGGLQEIFDNDLSISEPDNDEKNSNSDIVSNSIKDKTSNGNTQGIPWDYMKLSKEKEVMDASSNRGSVAGWHSLKPHANATKPHEDAKLSHEDVSNPHGDCTKQPLPDEQMNGTELKRESTNDLESDIRTSTDKRSTPETDMNSNTLTHMWTLNDEDLSCLPLVSNKYRIEGIRTRTDARQSSPIGRYLFERDKNSNLLRKLRKKAGAPRSSYMKNYVDNILKKYECDMRTALEAMELYWGIPIQLPCMKCYAKYGRTGENNIPSFRGRKGDDNNNRCLTCGSKVQTLSSLGKMIGEMRAILEEKDLVPHDVIPDGNCMFAAVVDQLRIRGDFSFNTDNLRQTAVNYLRENPNADDGTPLEMFLTDEETWQTYLYRMSGDGEWGDHIILRALAYVVNKKIVIYDSTSGHRETILYPKAHTYEKSSSEEEDQTSDDDVIYLGHVAESHYVSLRPKRWRQELLKGAHERSISLGLPQAEQRWLKCPVQDINFILRQVFRMYLLKKNEPKILEDCAPGRLETDKFVLERFGSRACNLVPYELKFESSGFDISIFFPSVKEEEKIDASFQDSVYTVFNTPYDTEIVSEATSAKDVDLIAINDVHIVGHLKLIPTIPKLWRGQTTSLVDNAEFLNVFEVNFCCSKEMFSSFSPKHSSDMNFVLAFKCSWPDVAKHWLHRYRKSGFPDENIVQNAVKNGCHVVPFTSDTRMADILDDPIYTMSPADNYTWVYSFAAAEKEMCRCLSSEQRQAFNVFKALVDTALRDIPLQLSVLKSVFFYACENIEKLSWRTNPGTCILILLKKIVECFRKGRVSHYFMPGKNLLNFIPEETITECYKRLEGLRLQPVVTLYFLLDQRNAMSSEIGCFIEEMIETLQVAANGGTVTRASQTLLPTCTELLPDLITQENYQIAMLVFLDMIEEKGIDVKLDGCRLLRKVMRGFYIGFSWCFALYFDIMQKTTLTAQLCEGYDRIHVTEVLGPDCIEELPNTLVPECFSINNGDLDFASRIYKVLSQCANVTTVINCMKYYLKRYGELAGDSLYLLSPQNRTVTGSPYEAMVANVFLPLLHVIYVDLYNFCSHSGREEEFREMMPMYTLIAESLGSPESLANIRIMRDGIDRSEKINSTL